MRLRSELKGAPRAAAMRGLLLVPEATLLGNDDERALRRVADDRPAALGVHEPGVVAEQTRRAEAPSAARVDNRASGAEPAERLVPGALHVDSASGVQTRLTVISFSVSVPVLSVQITVVSPSVSTDESRRTSAFRRAIR